jgi:glycosyltransferase involved in cell wall biosynthesis
MKVTIFRDYKEEEWHSMDVYVDNLVKALKAEYQKGIQIKDYTTLPGISRYFKSPHRHLRHVFRYIVNPAGVYFQQADIFHVADQANAHLISVLDPRKTVITCHDLTAPYWVMRHVKLTAKKRIKQHVEKWRLDYMKKVPRIISVSEATKNDLVETLKIFPEKIVVIPEGVENFFKPVTNPNILRDVRKRYKLPEKFILHIGVNFENKNIEGLFKTFSYLAKRDPEIYLVKIGQNWLDHQLHFLKTYPYADRIIHLGFADKQDLPALYSLAKVLVHLSLNEGFGFTVLEAMACGCPVIVSRIPALVELAGSAGLYISPNPTSNELNKIYSSLSDSRVISGHRRSGLLRAKLYRWEQCAKSTYQVYQEVVSLNKS